MSKRKNNCEGRGREIKIDNFGRERRRFKYYTYQDIGLAASELNSIAMYRARTSAHLSAQGQLSIRLITVLNRAPGGDSEAICGLWA
jgi:hypothetical protein